MLNRKGGFNFAKATLPLLLKSTELASPPTLIFTGATASLKGGPGLATFASGKFALRALAQSLSREFGPQGVHVSHVIIDGIIDTPRTQQFVIDHADAKLNPEAVSCFFFLFLLGFCFCFSQATIEINNPHCFIDCRNVLESTSTATFGVFV